MRVVFSSEPSNGPFEPNQKLRLRWTYLDDDTGLPADPVTVTMTVTENLTAPVTYTYPVPQLARDGVGVYRVDFLCSVVGRTRFTAVGTGPPGSEFGAGTYEISVVGAS